MALWILVLVGLLLWTGSKVQQARRSGRGPSPRRAEPAADVRRGIPTRRSYATTPTEASPTSTPARAPRVAPPAVQPREGTRKPSDRTASHAGSSAYARRSIRPGGER